MILLHQYHDEATQNFITGMVEAMIPNEVTIIIVLGGGTLALIGLFVYWWATDQLR